MVKARIFDQTDKDCGILEVLDDGTADTSEITDESVAQALQDFFIDPWGDWIPPGGTYGEDGTEDFDPGSPVWTSRLLKERLPRKTALRAELIDD